ncbi:MAG: hypothetical protein COA42_16725 [Alteromonadaceae bacterium]|nr:MAG: hypothetical protein COA42_16725 [Alteromonadaceae bacterium]
MPFLKFLAVLTCLILFYPANAEPLSKATADALDQQLITNAQRYTVVSQAVRLYKNDELIYQGIHGSANLQLSVAAKPEHIYPLFSIAKLFTGVALMQQVEKGKVSLGRSITEYLPHLPKHWRNITLKHCLNHTSGLPEYFSNELIEKGFLKDKRAVFDALQSEPMQFKTGETSRYNNTNYLIIAAILEAVTNKPFLTLVNDNIVSPLALQNTGYANGSDIVAGMVSGYWGKDGQWLVDRGINWPDYSFAHVALYSTLNDLEVFIKAVTQGELLSAKTLKQMWQPTILNDGTTGRYAYGWEYGAEDDFYRVGHEGGNRVRIRHYIFPTAPKDRYTIIYLTNGNGHDLWTSVLVDSLMSIVSPKQFPLAVASGLLIDAALADTSAPKLDRLMSELAENQAVAKYGVETFIMIQAYATLYSAGADKSLGLFALNTRQFPKSATAWVNLAEAWLRKGDKKQAIDGFKKALALAPKMSNAKQRLAELVNSDGEP